MGYIIPLRFIKVSNKRTDQKQFDVALCATRIIALASTDSYQARRTIHDEKKSGTLINACGTRAAKTAIFLDNGAVVASPLSVSVLMNAIEKSNTKAAPGQTVRLKVYDVVDEEPREDDEEMTEISGLYDVDEDIDELE
jgi:regulator of extracellular matrix RemA (YlzA/DUF370 family)